MSGETLNITGRYYRYYPWTNPLGEAEDALSLPLDETVFLLVDVYGLRTARGSYVARHPRVLLASADDPVGRSSARRSSWRRRRRSAGLVVYVTNYLSPGLSEGNERRNMSIRTRARRPDGVIPPTPILSTRRSSRPNRRAS
jgi:hypothetical protein